MAMLLSPELDTSFCVHVQALRTGHSPGSLSPMQLADFSSMIDAVLSMRDAEIQTCAKGVVRLCCNDVRSSDPAALLHQQLAFASRQQ